MSLTIILALAFLGSLIATGIQCLSLLSIDSIPLTQKGILIIPNLVINLICFLALLIQVVPGKSLNL